MSNQKNYNSIVFLTTLSVYLGLVLIGAPPILTQAALTRSFDVKNEIEFKDDLDNKPDREEFENLENNDFPPLFAQLLSEIKSEVKTGKIFLPIQANYSVHSFSKKVEIEIKGNTAECAPKISIGKTNADKFAEFLNQEFSSRAALSKDALTEQIYQNTIASSENRQVFVVTRLPRASIDEFLARKDAN